MKEVDLVALTALEMIEKLSVNSPGDKMGAIHIIAKAALKTIQEEEIS